MTTDAASADHGPRRVNWTAVITFYALACGISWPFFWWRDMEPASWRAWAIPGILKTASYMWGPGLAALICLVLFRRTHRRTITLLGPSPRRSLAFYLVPLVALAVLGGHELEGIPARLVPLAVGLVSFLTVFGEEFGWRGFLQDALRPLPTLWRYVLVGAMWELWHFTNRIHGRSALAILAVILIWYPATILLSWIIGTAAERSGSLLVAHTLHLWIDMVAEVPGWQTKATLGASVVLWALLLRTWPRRVAGPHAPIDERPSATAGGGLVA